MIRSLQAFCWIEFGMIAGYLGAVYKLCRYHPKLSWTKRESGMHVSVGWLCPQPPVGVAAPEKESVRSAVHMHVVRRQH